ncbi:beta-ketoacyl synthase N-terminal-like domain-containing protein [Teredinibacter sp. KSP-S5-2]|uniref:beta-ketoacyl synthase N-terminal-like domain-containing protein n=1 Tax=Teredinibacter sp. KSP-S5-2 TaxID=3034506 RepID=UPI002934A599|nr:beta-ketoacyl synthase N-terminal-like domain-containing protein [Teredinibacter sp. KSP-S5-2]WNO11549.1 beta-ketoacyl synthase N-terminal-like domain-containing protein [Teredinibacter sp. KSP-S5-2]
MSESKTDIVVTGLGVTSSIGQGKAEFTSALFSAAANFRVMQRPGRQFPSTDDALKTQFIGAEIDKLTLSDRIPAGLVRTASFSGQAALACLDEAWDDANLLDVDPTRIGLVVGGSNFQQRELVQIHDSYREKLAFLRPTYGLSFMDSDVCGMCTDVFGIRGVAYTIGGASASGQVAVLKAIQAVESGQVDVCIAIGALMDLSYWECQGFRALGAMGSERYASTPELACRPFDKARDGFIYGENCAAIVVEKATSANRPNISAYARVAGWSMRMDANRNPDPSFDGEVAVIQEALKKACISPSEVDYINPHGTGSGLGDETELKAITHCGLKKAYINSTKSIIGHGLTAAGAVEIAATLIQMRENKLHICRNLDDPMDTSFNWVRQEPLHTELNTALKMSMGFGGTNSALCLQAI